MDQGGLAAFLESVASRIDALDRQLRHISTPTAQPAEAIVSAASTAPARDSDLGSVAADLRQVRGNLTAGLATNRAVRRAASADGLRSRNLWARQRPADPWALPMSDQQRALSLLQAGGMAPMGNARGLHLGLSRGELAGTSLMAPPGGAVEPYSQLAAAAAAVAEDALGAQHRGRSAERLHVHLWASPPPAAPPPPQRPAPAPGQAMPGQQKGEGLWSGSGDLGHQQPTGSAAGAPPSGYPGSGTPFSLPSPGQSLNAWQEAAAAAAGAAAGEAAAANGNNAAATAAAAAAAAAAAVAASGGAGTWGSLQPDHSGYPSGGAPSASAPSPRTSHPPSADWATHPAAMWGPLSGSVAPPAVVAAAGGGPMVNAIPSTLTDRMVPGSFEPSYEGAPWGPEVAAGRALPPSMQSAVQAPPSLHLARMTASAGPGPGGGLPVFDQADAEAFAELGRKAPQPRDVIVPYNPGGVAIPDGVPQPPYPVEGMGNGSAIGVSSSISPGLDAEFPTSNGTTLLLSKEGSSRPAASGSNGHETGAAGMGSHMGPNAARGWARVPRDTPHSDWRPSGGSTAAPPGAGGPMMGSLTRNSRPASAGPSGRAGRYGPSVYQGIPGAAGLRDRDRERERERERAELHPAPSSWSSRPPTWYEGGSEASLSARGGIAGGAGLGDGEGLGLGGPWRLPDRGPGPSEDFLWAK